MDTERFIFELLGYVYLASWTIVYYPQIILNYRLKKLSGVSVGYVVYNNWGFLCYGTYVFTKRKIQQDNGLTESVTIHDCIFAFHSFFATTTLVVQYFLYRDKKTPGLARKDKTILSILVIIPVTALFAAISGNIDWVQTTHIKEAKFCKGDEDDECSHVHDHIINFIAILGWVKILITLVKYPSQILLNYSNKSTRGLSKGSVALDTTGSLCSLMQNVIHAVLTDDFEFILGNLPKVGLGAFSLFYCCILLLQFKLYEKNSRRSRSSGGLEMMTRSKNPNGMYKKFKDGEDVAEEYENNASDRGEGPRKRQSNLRKASFLDVERASGNQYLELEGTKTRGSAQGSDSGAAQVTSESMGAMPHGSKLATQIPPTTEAIE